MTFDATVNLGQIIEAGGFLVSVVAAYFAVKSDVRVLSGRENSRHESNLERMDRIESELAKQTNILVSLASQEQKIEGLAMRLSFLETRRNQP